MIPGTELVIAALCCYVEIRTTVFKAVNTYTLPSDARRAGTGYYVSLLSYVDHNLFTFVVPFAIGCLSKMVMFFFVFV